MTIHSAFNFIANSFTMLIEKYKIIVSTKSKTLIYQSFICNVQLIITSELENLYSAD